MRDFIRRYLPKPAQLVEVVVMRGHLVTCGCGQVWKAATYARNSEGRETVLGLHEQSCPNCGKGATVSTTSAIEEWTEQVTISRKAGTAGDGTVKNPPRW